MHFIIVPVTPLAQNCTLLCCEQTRRAAVIDPGGEVDRIISLAQSEDVEIEKILITHGHFDHIGGVEELAGRLSIPIEGPHREDRFLVESLPKQCKFYDFPVAQSFTPDRWLEQGEQVTFGNQQLEVLHCPGHTPGHVVYFQKNEKLLQVGDVLFKGSIGRTDFPRGNHETLIRSIHEKLWPLGDDVQFIPGHGPLSTIGEERGTNPYV